MYSSITSPTDSATTYKSVNSQKWSYMNKCYTVNKQTDDDDSELFAISHSVL